MIVDKATCKMRKVINFLSVFIVFGHKAQKERDKRYGSDDNFFYPATS